MHKCPVPLASPKQQWGSPKATTRGRELHTTPPAVCTNGSECADKRKRAPSREAHTQPTNWEQRPCRFLLGGRVVSFFACFEVIFGVGLAYAARTPLVLHATELRGGGGVGGEGGEGGGGVCAYSL